jgi:hypothetical protein
MAVRLLGGPSGLCQCLSPETVSGVPYPTDPAIRALPRSQAYVSQFRSYRKLDRSPWQPGSPIITPSLNLNFSMSGHTRDITPLLDISSRDIIDPSKQISIKQASIQQTSIQQPSKQANKQRNKQTRKTTRLTYIEHRLPKQLTYSVVSGRKRSLQLPHDPQAFPISEPFSNLQSRLAL